MADLICPTGHRVPEASVTFEGDAQRPQCPVCKALGITTGESNWTRPAFPSDGSRWSRRLLTAPLWTVAAGFVAMALATVLELAYYLANRNGAPTDSLVVLSTVSQALGALLVSIAAMVAATRVARR